MQIHKTHIIAIIIVMAGAIGLVSLLAWTANKSINMKHGFLRNFTSQKLLKTNSIERESDIVNIIGMHGENIFYQTKNASKVFITDRQLFSTKYITVGGANDRKISSLFHCFADSAGIFTLAGNARLLIINRPDAKSQVFKFPKNLFTRAVMINENSYVFRGFDPAIKREQVFFKGDLNTGEITRETSITEQKNDYGFSTDGTLTYDSNTGIINYTPFYQNTVFGIDTNLNLLYSAKTITSTWDSNIEIGEIDESNKHKTVTNATPKHILNYYSSVSNGLLFNYSSLKADNEKASDFSDNSVIDIYDIKTGKYKHSFYIPRFNGEKMLSFKIFDRQLIALYKSHIVAYKII